MKPELVDGPMRHEAVEVRWAEVASREHGGSEWLEIGGIAEHNLTFLSETTTTKKPHVMEAVWWSSSIQLVSTFHFRSSLLWHSMRLARCGTKHLALVIDCMSITDPTIFRWRDCAGCYVRDIIGIIHRTPLQHLGGLFLTFITNGLGRDVRVYIDHDSCIWDGAWHSQRSDIKSIWSPSWSKKRFFYSANPRWPCIRLGLSTSLSLVGWSMSSTMATISL